MQELRLVAVSEDGTYAVLTSPGTSGRYSLRIDDRLRIVARGQFSRLAQYEIEVEAPLRPKEIQDRIRAGETAEEIAEMAGVPVERVRRFEGPPLAERAHQAAEAQGATLRQQGDSGPGQRLGDVVSERLRRWGVDPEEAEWDSCKHADSTWQVQLRFNSGNRPYLAEWVFEPRRKHVAPLDDTAARLCLPDQGATDPGPPGQAAPSATVTPIGSRLGQTVGADHDTRRPPEPALTAAGARPLSQQPPADTMHPAGTQQPGRERPARKAAGGRSRRSSVPSWDEIMLGTSRNQD